jgi:hypothetical protein
VAPYIQPYLDSNEDDDDDDDRNTRLGRPSMQGLYQVGEVQFLKGSFRFSVGFSLLRKTIW